MITAALFMPLLQAVLFWPIVISTISSSYGLLLSARILLQTIIPTTAREARSSSPQRIAVSIWNRLRERWLKLQFRGGVVILNLLFTLFALSRKVLLIEPPRQRAFRWGGGGGGGGENVASGGLFFK